MFRNFGPLEIGLIVLVIVLLFGARKLPEAARGLGRSLKIFKAETKGLVGGDDDEEPSTAAPQQQTQQPQAVTPAPQQPAPYATPTTQAPAEQQYAHPATPAAAPAAAPQQPAAGAPDGSGRSEA
jgi:sec-independent protein translocase protein TatA